MHRQVSTDDRNRRVRLVARLPVIPGGPSAWARARKDPTTRRAMAAVAVAAGVLSLLPLAFWLLGPQAAGLMILSVVIAPTTGAVLGALAAVRNAWRERPARLQAEMLARGLCPACGYGLAGVPPEEDGCRRCPECSAFWRRPEPGRVVVR